MSLWLLRGLTATALMLLAHTAVAQHDHATHTEPAPPADAAAHAGHDASADTSSEREHVAPDPPAQVMHDMPYREMAVMMGMDDRESFGKLAFDELDLSRADRQTLLSWDSYAWYGNDDAKLWLKSAGERQEDHPAQGDLEAFYDRVIGRWWNLQAGVRHDFGDGPSRDWLALGVQGLAPYFFDIEATAYLGEQGRAALRLAADYELLLTQRLILRPSLELDAYSKDDPQNGIASGLSSAELGLRLRYEIRREFAPYVGVAWDKRFGDSANLVRASGEDASEVRWLAGVRFWF